LRPLAKPALSDYLVGMRDKPPLDIGGSLTDFWEYIRADRPHRWPALGLAITIPGVMLYFIADAFTTPAPTGPQVTYVQSWRADRSDYEVRRDWLARARAANQANQQRREAMGGFAEAIGQDYDAQRAQAEFDNAYADIAAMEREVDVAERERRPMRTIQQLRDAGLAPAPLPPRRPDRAQRRP
jgi:hypothetical protein